MFEPTGGANMNIIVITFLSLALMVAVGVLVREVKLRRALQRLLYRVLERWRSRPNETNSSNTDGVDTHRDGRLP